MRWMHFVCSGHIVYFNRRDSAARCMAGHAARSVMKILLDSDWRYRFLWSGQFRGVTENIVKTLTCKGEDTDIT